MVAAKQKNVVKKKRGVIKFGILANCNKILLFAMKDLSNIVASLAETSFVIERERVRRLYDVYL